MRIIPVNRYRQFNREIVQNPYKSSSVETEDCVVLRNKEVRNTVQTMKTGPRNLGGVAVKLSEFSVCDVRGSIQVHIAASTRSLWGFSVPAACLQIQELGFDKVEIWLNEIRSTEAFKVAKDPEIRCGIIERSEPSKPRRNLSRKRSGCTHVFGSCPFCEASESCASYHSVVSQGTPFNTEIDHFASVMRFASGGIPPVCRNQDVHVD